MKLHFNALILLLLIITFGCTKEELDPSLFSPELSDFKIENKRIGQPPFLLKKPVTASDGAISYVTKDSALVKISGDTVTLKAIGNCTIYAVQRGTEKYHADTISASFLISDSLSANLTNFPAITKRLGEPAFDLPNPQSDHNGTFTFRTNDTSIVAINGRTVTIKKEGKCMITADQAANGEYKKANISAELTVAPRLTAVITSVTFPVKKVGDPAFTFEEPKSTSKGVFSYSSTNTAVARITGRTITIIGAGKTTIIITQGEAGIYKTSTINTELTVVDNPILSTLQDVDGNTYRAVKIGTQIWMMENLKTKHYRDGTPIPNLKTNADWINLRDKGGYTMYDNLEQSGDTYGFFYNKAAVEDTRQLAPNGWHIPSKEEWETLHKYIGGKREDGSHLQETGTDHWVASNDTNNSTLFTGLGAGYRLSDGVFESKGFDAVWWSTGTVPYYDLYSKGYLEAGPQQYINISGCSVRCIKD